MGLGLVALIALIANLALASTALGKGTLFAVGQTNSVASNSIGADGGLAPVNTLSDASTPRSGAVSPDARFLYITNFGGASVGGYAIAANGSISSIGTPAPTVPAGQPEGLAITPNGNFLYAANTAQASVSGFQRNTSTGALTSLGAATPTGNGPDGIAISRDGAHLYAANETDDDISVFDIGSNGVLIPHGPDVTTGDQPNGIAVTPDGRFLYVVVDGGDDAVRGYSIGASGGLTPIGTANTADNPFGLAISPDGRFLYTANFGGGNVSGFSIGADGSLTSVGGPFPSGSTLTYWVEAAPNSRQVYAANDVDPGRISAFNIGTGGALSALSGSPFPSTVKLLELQSIAITPNQGPTAQFTTTPAASGSPSTFDATGSTDSDGGTVTRFDWDFGDGTTLPDGGPTPSHVYAQPGNYEVALTVTDDEGCSTQVIFTGQTVDCNGSGAARSQQTVVVPAGGGGTPDLTLSGKKKQKLAKTVKVKAVTQEDTEAVAKGSLAIQPKKGKRALRGSKLKKATADLAAGVPTTMKPKLPKKAFKKAKRTLASGGKVKAKVTVKATDADGDTDKAKRTIKLTKR